MHTNTFYFDTGVRFYALRNPAGKFLKDQTVSPNGILLINVYADAPIGSKMLFACDDPDLPDGKRPGISVFPISGGLCSKFGYFQLPEKWENTELIN